MRRSQVIGFLILGAMVLIALLFGGQISHHVCGADDGSVAHLFNCP